MDSYQYSTGGQETSLLVRSDLKLSFMLIVLIRKALEALKLPVITDIVAVLQGVCETQV